MLITNRGIWGIAFLSALSFHSIASGDTAASVSVLNRAPTLLVEGDSTTTWRYIPDFIRGSVIYSTPTVPIPSGDPAAGVAEITVTQSGKLYIAADYGYEGNSSGGWTDTRITREELEAMGWLYDADMRYGDGRTFRLFEKEVTAGEVLDLRVNKYVPPFAITTWQYTGNVPSQAAPWPTYGPVAVADFTPFKLDSAFSGFTNVPDELKDYWAFGVERRPSDGITDFSVIQDSKVLLAGFFGYEGNDEGDWNDYRLTLADMLTTGWTPTGQMTDLQGRVWDIIEKDLHAGDTFSLRFNKYTAPMVMVSAIPEASSVLLTGASAILVAAGAFVRRR